MRAVFFKFLVAATFFCTFNSQSMADVETGIYHDFYIGQSCPLQKIYVGDGEGASQNYSFFMQSLVGKLSEGGDPCAMAMVLNLQSFVLFLINNNKVEAYNAFFEELNLFYQKNIESEKTDKKKCRLHTNPQNENVESCLSDHTVDLAILSNRAWFDYFVEDIREQRGWDSAISSTLIGGGGILAIGVLFRSQIKRAGVKVIKKIGAKLKPLLERNTTTFVRGGATGSAGGAANRLRSGQTDLDLKKKIETFKPPLNFINFLEGEVYRENTLEEPSWWDLGLDLGVTLGAGILPAVLSEMAVERLALLVPTLSSSLGARIASKSKVFLESPLARIFAAVVGTVTAGNFLLTEWDRYKLKEQLAELNGGIEALKEEIRGRDPRELSTYLMAQELVSLTENLSLIYAAPVVSKLERTYTQYSTQALCVPIHAARLETSSEDFQKDFLRLSWPDIERNTDSAFSGDRQEFYDKAFETLNDTQAFITSEIKISEYLGLKMRLYDVAEYLLKFKNPTVFKQKIRTAIGTNVSRASSHGKALVDFSRSYQRATPPYFSETPIPLWNGYLEGLEFYTKAKEEGRAGYGFSCEYGMFPDLFYNFWHYKRIVPCGATRSGEFESCRAR